MARPQLSSRTGPTYQLAEFMNDNWDKTVGRTNEEVAAELGYKAANMISMWRTGKTRVPLEKLPDFARLMKLDLGVLLPMWLEQSWGERVDAEIQLQRFASRITTDHEAPVILAIRGATKMRDPAWSPDQILATTAVLSDPDVLKAALAAAKLKGHTLAD